MKKMVTINLVMGQKPVEYYRKGNEVFVRLKMFKGQSVAMPEKKMFRFKVDIHGTLENVLPADFAVVKETVEQIDVDFEIVELMFRELFEKAERVKLLSKLLDVFEVAKVGDQIGEIAIPYEKFIKLNNFLEMACYKPLETELVF